MYGQVRGRPATDPPGQARTNTLSGSGPRGWGAPAHPAHAKLTASSRASAMSWGIGRGGTQCDDCEGGVRDHTVGAPMQRVGG